jgi:DNA processing protein
MSYYVPPAAATRLSSTAAGLPDSLSEHMPWLHLAGDQSLLGMPSVSIIGSRNASEKGRRRAARLATALAREGVVVMSGLAEGIDAAAHEAAMLVGRTVAVIGTPLSRVYPAQHAALQRRIYTDHLLVSPFEEGEQTYPSSFPARNRVMARLSRATVIIEATNKSGTLHQADECAQAERPLFIVASIYEDKTLSWPRRFPKAIPLSRAEQVTDLLFKAQS